MLNAIVGGRGSGKSTVVHALRLAAGRESEIARLNSASVPRSTFENFRRVPRNRFEGGALTNDTQILWIVVRDGIRHRITWQNNHTDVTVEYEAEDHSWTESSSQSVTPERFPIRIFSQGQIAELTTGSQPALLHLIDESAGLSALKSRLVEAHNKYFKSKTNIRELERQLQLEADLSVQLEDVERKLKHFDSSDYSSVLKTYRHRVRQQAEASNRFTRIDKIARRIDRWSKTIQLDDTPEGLLDKSTLAGQSYFEVVNSLDKKVDRVAGVLQKEAETLRSIVKEKKRLLSGSVWQKETDKAKEKYHHLVTDIQNERNLDPSEYGFLIQERQQLRRDLDNLESKKKERSRRMEESFKCLLEIQEVRRSISNKRQEFLSSTLAGNDFVEVSVKPYSEDIREIERSLRRVLGVMDRRFQNDILTFSNGQPKAGIVADLFRDLSTDSSQRSGVLECRLETLKARLESACQGEEQFGGHFNNYLNREFDQDPSFLDRIWAWFPEDGLSVKYSPAGDGSAFRPIEQASAGQRSAALLAFILTHGTDPLLLDQPEDDLDNRLIYDLIVRQIREGKISRQIIVVTHNPNIVINGDAELVHVMEFVSRLGQCVVLASGSLEEDRIQEEVCQVMEGGREAFRSRYRRLKMELPNV